MNQIEVWDHAKKVLQIPQISRPSVFHFSGWQYCIHSHIFVIAYSTEVVCHCMQQCQDENHYTKKTDVCHYVTMVLHIILVLVNILVPSNTFIWSGNCGNWILETKYVDWNWYLEFWLCKLIHSLNKICWYYISYHRLFICFKTWVLTSAFKLFTSLFESLLAL